MTLRQARLKRKLTQEQLAAIAGVDQATISNLESGNIAAPSWPTVSRISQALKVKPEDLFPVQQETA
jgi:transcriptional regulator with XRE-family HTH domain